MFFEEFLVVCASILAVIGVIVLWLTADSIGEFFDSAHSKRIHKSKGKKIPH